MHRRALPIAEQVCRLHGDDADNWLTTDEAAAHCGCSVKTLRRAISAGQIKHEAIGRGAARLRFHKRTLDAWNTRRLKRNTSAAARRSNRKESR